MKKLNEYIRRLFYDYKWAIGYREVGNDFLLPSKNDSFKYKLLSLKSGYWGADPFVYTKEGETFIFFEYTCIKKYKSVLAVKKISPNEEDVHIIYEFEGHTSYPCIFEHLGKIYIIPETIDDSSIQLLECVQWPYKWVKNKEIIKNFNAVDTTFLSKDGNCYIITYNIPDNRASERNLYLGTMNNSTLELIDLQKVVEYHSEDGRPGGHVLKLNNDNIIRVVQPGNEFYGEKIEFYSVLLGNNGEYSEYKIGELLPEQIITDIPISIVGVHTYNRNEYFEVVDIRLDYEFDMFRPIKRVFQIFNLFGYGLYDQRKMYLDRNNPAHLNNK